MARNSNRSANSATAESTDNRSEAMTLAGVEAEAAIAAHQGCFWFYGARWDNVTVTPDGIVIEGYTVNPDYVSVGPERIINDLTKRVRRAPLWPGAKYIAGFDPDPFPTPQSITTHMTQFYKGAEDENSSKVPEYVLKAAAGYKQRAGGDLLRKRGPKPAGLAQILHTLSEIDPADLRNLNVDESEIEQLVALARDARNKMAGSDTEATTAAS